MGIDESHYGSDHWQVAITLGNLANAVGDLGDTERQRELLERALDIQESHYGSDHRRVATTLNNLANAVGNLGDPERQRELLERSLRIKETHYGSDHWQVAMTLVSLGQAHESLDDLAKALACALRAKRQFLPAQRRYIEIAENDIARYQKRIAEQEQTSPESEFPLNTAAILSECGLFSGLESSDDRYFSDNIDGSDVVSSAKRQRPN